MNCINKKLQLTLKICYGIKILQYSRIISKKYCHKLKIILFPNIIYLISFFSILSFISWSPLALIHTRFFSVILYCHNQSRKSPITCYLHKVSLQVILSLCCHFLTKNHRVYKRSISLHYETANYHSPSRDPARRHILPDGLHQTVKWTHPH